MEVVNQLLVVIYGGMSNDELAEIQVRSIEQLTVLEELRSKFKSTVVG